MEIILIRLLQLILSISLLILLHEGGHFFFARLFGVRVEKFYLFFDPWFHLFEFKPKGSHTRYGLGWLPLGGYCKIAGMVDESFDTKQLEQPVKEWEFRSKPAYQRLLIMLGGVMVNFFLALFIYSMVLFYWGDNYVKVSDMTDGMVFNKEAKALGFEDGDVLLGTNKGEFKDFGADLFRDISEATRVDVLRDGQKVSFAMPGNLDLIKMFKSTPRFLMYKSANTIDSVFVGSVAQKAGILKGDTIVEIAGRKISSYNEYDEAVGVLADVLSVAKTSADSAKALNTTIAFVHAGDSVINRVNVRLADNLILGVGFTNNLAKYKQTHVSYSFFESFPAGIAHGIGVLKGYVSDLKYLFTSDGAKSMGGFGTIASLFPPVWDWQIFWQMTAFLSIMLAFMNLLPIPALDGGHVIFLLYEMITGRKPGEKFLVRAEFVGFVILLGLMIFANLNDILRAFGISY